MPIIRDSALIYFPKDTDQISKYLDLTKFISLLSTRSLFFCRLDKLEDKFEGTTAKRNFELRVEWFRQTNRFLESPLNEEEILKEVEEMYQYDQKVKEFNCVCCWNKEKIESAALWKIYSDFGKGIMIKSSVSKLINSLAKTPEAIYLSEIKYIDYHKDIMPDGNSFFPIIHKQTPYSFENEIRLIHSVDFPQIGKNYPWEKEFIEEGKLVSVDVPLLIDQIVVAPFAPKWFVSLVKELLTKFGYEIEVKKSSLSS